MLTSVYKTAKTRFTERFTPGGKRSDNTIMTAGIITIKDATTKVD